MTVFLAAVFTSFSIATSAYAAEAYKTDYVDLSRQSAVLYRPVTTTEKAGVGIVVMHSNDDYLNFPANAELSKRGYTVLATIPSAGSDMEPKLLNIKAAVEYLRKMPGIKKVILLGHSGGATTMTAYQYLAEKGLGGLKGKIFTDYSDKVANLPKADGLLLLDANWGNSLMTLFSLDPNIVANNSGRYAAKPLDLADTSVGYNPNGSRYTEAFQKAFLRAQRNRLTKLIDEAGSRWQMIKSGKGNFVDDEPFFIAGASQIRPFNKLFPQDLNLFSHTVKAWPLIHGNGTLTKEVVHTVRAPMRPDAPSDTMFAALPTTVRGFLSMIAINVDEDFRITETGVTGVHFDSNINNAEGNVQGITVPSLFMGMTGSWEFSAAETIYNNSAAADKKLAYVEGASHMFAPDRDAEQFNHVKYGDTTKALFDYVDLWIAKRGRFL